MEHADMDTLLDFEAPEALGIDGKSISGEAITDLRPSEAVASMPIEHLGQPGYPVSEQDDGAARLYVRDYEDDEPREIPSDQWRFARQTADGVVPSTRDLWIDGGFTPGKIYEVVYPTDRSPVVGTGLLAFRDAALFLRTWQRAYERVHGFGISRVVASSDTCSTSASTAIPTTSRRRSSTACTSTSPVESAASSTVATVSPHNSSSPDQSTSSPSPMSCATTH